MGNLSEAIPRNSATSWAKTQMNMSTSKCHRRKWNTRGGEREGERVVSAAAAAVATEEGIAIAIAIRDVVAVVVVGLPAIAISRPLARSGTELNSSWSWSWTWAATATVIVVPAAAASFSAICRGRTIKRMCHKEQQEEQAEQWQQTEKEEEQEQELLITADLVQLIKATAANEVVAKRDANIHNLIKDATTVCTHTHAHTQTHGT